MEHRDPARQPVLTTLEGCPVDGDNEAVTLGLRDRGFVQLQDFYAMEKLAHFNRERIPERVVHAKGAGAFGFFEVTHDMSRYTRAKVFCGVGKHTEVFARFSPVNGERGAPDTQRDPRGFAVKFYTEEGNLDLVCNDTPVFFVRDFIKFPDLIHSQKRHPVTNLHDADSYWDFLSLTPESVHMVTMLFSDRGIPRSFRALHGFGNHAFMWYNEDKQYVYVKYHLLADLGFQTLTAEEGAKIAGENPDYCSEDLAKAIEQGNFPSWKLFVQIMTPEQAKKYRFDPFDVTKVWYHKDFPLMEVGRMVLNRNPTNYFLDVEQAAFCPGNLVPGIAPSPDRMLQGRLFFYSDAQRYRLGVNHHLIPVNKSRAPVHTTQRDGFMMVSTNGKDEHPYFPNSLDGPGPDASFAPPVLEVEGIVGRHPQIADDPIDFEQAEQLYSRVMNDEARAHLIHNLSIHLGNAKPNIQYRQCAQFWKVCPDYGKRVAEALHLDVSRVEQLAKMKQVGIVEATKMPSLLPEKPNEPVPALAPGQPQSHGYPPKGQHMVGTE